MVTWMSAVHSLKHVTRRPLENHSTLNASLFPTSQLLNSLSVDPDAECKYGLYFRDGKRKVDYILVYHHKRASGSRTLARRGLQNDMVLGTRSSRQDQPLPGKGSPVDAGSPEAPMDYHEDDKRFRREEYEGNLLEAGLELEHDEDVSVASCWLGTPGGHGPGKSVCRRWGGGEGKQGAGHL